ncbi:unnamed protein product [Adineta steineri]|uniref:Protein sleepless n=1 Tax=Adineta steineri TaxID=433720 RepID=A0A815UUC7_9BILA|nr:unnamed protein product [Adineta steineri]CAF4016678.1 unnamed protein product [Adineta steineri]
MIGFENVLSYQCYYCEYPTDTRCLDPFNTTTLTTVTGSAACLATKGRLNGKDIIGRQGLTYPQMDQHCIGGINGCKYGRRGNDNAEICCCTSDKCNNGNTQVGKLYLIGLIAGGRFILQLLF